MRRLVVFVMLGKDVGRDEYTVRSQFAFGHDTRFFLEQIRHDAFETHGRLERAIFDIKATRDAVSLVDR